MSAKHAETIVESGKEIFIPLNKLKKSPKNARKDAAQSFVGYPCS